jgi:hypothetical protein
LWLAATHPDPEEKSVAPKAVPQQPAPPPKETHIVLQPTAGVDSESLAVLAASLSVVLGVPFRIKSVSEYRPPQAAVENLMQYWSLEGRRQIYTSHKIR